MENHETRGTMERGKYLALRLEGTKEKPESANEGGYTVYIR